MGLRSIMRGHEIYCLDTDRTHWMYLDGSPADDNRPCPRCGNKRLPDGEDFCLGHLPGVVSACCGHGTGMGRIEFENGLVIMGNFKIFSKED